MWSSWQMRLASERHETRHSRYFFFAAFLADFFATFCVAAAFFTAFFLAALGVAEELFADLPPKA